MSTTIRKRKEPPSSLDRFELSNHVANNNLLAFNRLVHTSRELIVHVQFSDLVLFSTENRFALRTVLVRKFDIQKSHKTNLLPKIGHLMFSNVRQNRSRTKSWASLQP